MPDPMSAERLAEIGRHYSTDPEVKELLAEIDLFHRGGRELGRVIEQDSIEVCRLTGVPRSEDGDADFEVAWQLLAEMPIEIARLRDEAWRHALANDGCVPGAAYRDAGDEIERLRAQVVIAWDDGFQDACDLTTVDYAPNGPMEGENPYRAVMTAGVVAQWSAMSEPTDGPALAEARRKGAVEALRAAAESYYGDEGPGNPLSTATWLRERADQIERGEQ